MLDAKSSVQKGNKRARSIVALAVIIVAAFVMQLQPVAANPGGGFPCGSGCAQSTPRP